MAKQTIMLGYAIISNIHTAKESGTSISHDPDVGEPICTHLTYPCIVQLPIM